MNTCIRLVFYAMLFKSGFLPAQVAISTDKMNVLYPGLENPITVVVSDVPDSNLLLIPSMGEISRTSASHYGWMICRRDTNFATLTIRDLQGDSIIETLNFRVNRIPDPIPIFGRKHRQSVIGNAEYCGNYGGISVLLESFDFDVKCNVLYFDVFYIQTGADGMVRRNTGARWSSEVKELIYKAIPGDEYHFYNIAYRCGCDPMVHHLSDELHYKIK